MADSAKGHPLHVFLHISDSLAVGLDQIKECGQDKNGQRSCVSCVPSASGASSSVFHVLSLAAGTEGLTWQSHLILLLEKNCLTSTGLCVNRNQLLLCKSINIWDLFVSVGTVNYPETECFSWQIICHLVVSEPEPIAEAHESIVQTQIKSQGVIHKFSYMVGITSWPTSMMFLMPPAPPPTVITASFYLNLYILVNNSLFKKHLQGNCWVSMA